jgi:hypothetical protein
MPDDVRYPQQLLVLTCIIYYLIKILECILVSVFLENCRIRILVSF